MRINYPARYDFFLDDQLTYRERLEAFKLEKLATPLFDAQARQLIASNEELSARGIRAIDASSKRISGEIGRQTEVLESALGSISEGMDELNSSLQDIATTLNAGFSELILRQGKMADTLEQLVKLAANPSLTWALEQFTLARDEVRRGLYAEALESVQNAINGYGSNAGYKTEFRFHGLLGMLHLGEFNDHPLELIDPVSSEKSFIYAAKLCQKDDPIAFVRMKLLASRAAYLNQNIDGALDHALGAVTMLGEWSQNLGTSLEHDWVKALWLESNFNAARMQISKSAKEGSAIPQWSLQALKVIFSNDMKYAVAATTDPLLGARPELAKAISETVGAMNDERRAAAASMDTKFLEFSSVLKEKLGQSKNLTRSEAFDFSDEMNLAPLPESVFGNTLTSAFDGKRAFSERLEFFRDTARKVNDKTSKALSFEHELTSDKKMNAAAESWVEKSLKGYFYSVFGISALGFIINRLTSHDSIWGGIAVFFMSLFLFGIIFAVVFTIIGYFGGFVAKSANDNRSENKNEFDKLRAAALSFASYKDFSLDLNKGGLSIDNLRSILRTAR